MTTESRLRRAAEDTHRTISGLRPPSLRPERRLPLSLRWAVAAAVILTALLIPLMQVGQPVAQPLDLGPGEVVLLEEPLVVKGAPAPSPEFDASKLGTRAGLGDIEDPSLLARMTLFYPENTNATIVKITVIGVTDAGSTAAILHRSITKCLWVRTGDYQSCRLFGTLDAPGVNSRGLAGAMVWGPLPEGTSVVGLHYGQTSLWQEPVGGYALFDTDMGDGDQFALTAYGSDGESLHSEIGSFTR